MQPTMIGRYASSLLLAMCWLTPTLTGQDQVRAIKPDHLPASANHFSSPGVDAGDYLYVSTSPARVRAARAVRSHLRSPR
ncbi:MAG TPA: hypothetical protein VLK33_15630, partial [Terriglobales bacterium]|nr:hypothetical protein [Terriglobales bacterium]